MLKLGWLGSDPTSVLRAVIRPSAEARLVLYLNSLESLHCRCPGMSLSSWPRNTGVCRAGSLGLGRHNFDIACIPEFKLKIGVGGDEAPSRVCPISYPLLAFLSCPTLLSPPCSGYLKGSPSETTCTWPTISRWEWHRQWVSSVSVSLSFGRHSRTLLLGCCEFVSWKAHRVVSCVPYVELRY